MIIRRAVSFLILQGVLVLCIAQGPQARSNSGAPPALLALLANAPTGSRSALPAQLQSPQQNRQLQTPNYSTGTQRLPYPVPRSPTNQARSTLSQPQTSKKQISQQVNRYMQPRNTQISPNTFIQRPPTNPRTQQNVMMSMMRNRVPNRKPSSFQQATKTLQTLYPRPQKLQMPYTRPQKLQMPYTRPLSMQTPYTRPQNMQTPYTRPQNMQTPYTRPQNMQTPYARPHSIKTPYPRFQNMQTPYPRFQNTKTPYPRLQNMKNPYPRFQNMQTQNSFNMQPLGQQEWGRGQWGQQPMGNAGFPQFGGPSPPSRPPIGAARESNKGMNMLQTMMMMSALSGEPLEFPTRGRGRARGVGGMSRRGLGGLGGLGGTNPLMGGEGGLAGVLAMMATMPEMTGATSGGLFGMGGNSGRRTGSGGSQMKNMMNKMMMMNLMGIDMPDPPASGTSGGTAGQAPSPVSGFLDAILRMSGGGGGGTGTQPRSAWASETVYDPVLPSAPNNDLFGLGIGGAI